MENTKICTKCGIEYPATLEYFGKKKGGKFGRKAICRICETSKHKIYRENNKEKLTAKCKIYRENNKEKIASIHKIYYENNKEKINAKCKIYYENNKEKMTSKCKIYRENNKEKINAIHKISRENLSDSYVKELLTVKSGLSCKDIPHELIEIKRVQLLIERHIKNQTT